MARFQASLIFLVACLVSQARAQYVTSADTYYKMVMAHALLMTWVFLIAIPFGIGVARYARGSLSHSAWFRTHSLTMSIVAGVPFLAAWIIGYLMASPYNFTVAHTQMGLAIFILFWCQALLGLTNHFIYKRNPNRTHRPWHNYLHFWLGRIIFILALAQIPLGLLFFSPYGLFAAYAVWTFFLLCLFGILEWRLQRSNNATTKGEEKDGGENDASL